MYIRCAVLVVVAHCQLQTKRQQRLDGVLFAREHTYADCPSREVLTALWLGAILITVVRDVLLR